MRGIRFLRYPALRRLLRGASPSPPLPLSDTALLALADEFAANGLALRRLVDGDGRDTSDIPEFSERADREAELVSMMIATPARSLAGLHAKARCTRFRSNERGFDPATHLSLSLADDLLRLVPSPSPSFEDFRSDVGARPHQIQEQNMNNDLDHDLRLAILRRNARWRQTIDAFKMIGAFAVAALIVLPANGVALTLLPFTVLLAMSLTATGLAFFLLRFINHRA